MSDLANNREFTELGQLAENIFDLDFYNLEQDEKFLFNLEAASFYHQQALRINSLFLNSLYWEHRCSEIKKRGFLIILRLSASEVSEIDESKIKEKGVDAIQIQVEKTVELQALTHLKEIPFYVTIFAKRKEDFTLYLKNMESFLRERIFFRFEFPTEISSDYLSCREIQNLLVSFGKKKLEMKVDPGSSVFERKFPSEELSPYLNPIFQKESGAPNIKMSLVIPTYNNKYFLLNVLRHLFEQDYAKDAFEVIVIDDGSRDGTEEYIRTNLVQHTEGVNIKYFYWKKSHPDLFRAGHARNLGAYCARGSTLVFLDSDMLVPRNFLNVLEKDMASSDVVQFVRHHIYPQKSTSHIQYSDVVGNDVYIEDEKYWQPFFSSTLWEDLDLHWKYTCTYCLAVKKEKFQKIGGFRRAYTSYGFEDTELGFKLFKSGSKFLLNKTICYHLTKEEKFIDTKLGHYQRQNILAKTAKVFFRNNPDTDIYRHFHFYLLEEKIWYWRLKSKLKRLFQGTQKI